jgi:hypothetical protein
MDYEQREDEDLEQFRERLRREYRRDFPSLAAIALPGPWDERDRIFLEYMTGEPRGERRGTRETDL